jgi:hypothetical protein
VQLVQLAQQRVVELEQQELLQHQRHQLLQDEHQPEQLNQLRHRLK